MKIGVIGAMEYVKSLKLPSDSIWLSKSGMFTLLTELLFKKFKGDYTYPDFNKIREKLLNIDEKEKHNDGSSIYFNFYQYMYQSTGSKKGRMIRGEVLRKELEIL